MSKPVTLNKAELNVLNSIQNVGERQATKARLLKEKQDKAEIKNAEFKALTDKWAANRSQPLDVEVRDLKNGDQIIIIKGSGTRYGASFTVDRFMEFVSKLPSMKATVAPLIRERK